MQVGIPRAEGTPADGGRFVSSKPRNGRGPERLP